MTIIWDEHKRRCNIEKHGMDFADLTYEFFLTSINISAKDGRFKAIGQLDDGAIVVVYETLGREALSVISMRRANRKERNML